MKKVVVTGATSMLGMNLIELLLKENIEVIGIIRKNSNKKNTLPANCTVVECDLCNLAEYIPEVTDCDTFYHFSWEGTVAQERNDINLQIKNIQYTLDALTLAKKFGCKRFVGIGSQAEYGRVEGTVSNKTLTNPETAYGVAKLTAGQMSRIYAEDLGIEHIWTRVFSTYGRYDKIDTMVMTSIHKMLQGESPEYTKAEQMWDYLYSEDAAKAFYVVGEKGLAGETYCIGSGKTRKLCDYIKEIRNAINPNIELKLGQVSYMPKQVMNLCADISNLTKDTGFVPEIEFEEGIKHTISWYKEKQSK